MSEYLESKKIEELPRLPLKGTLDLTYRCNNNCRHCWLRIPPTSQERQKELSLDELIKIVDEARGMGCRRWSISGGEPMLRADFAEIFDYITRKSVAYSLNTNGSLITPEIAQLMKRKGNKMVALYGATAEVHDHITRNPGSFEATMRGFAYLKEAGAGSTVQVIPMTDNYHQFDDMARLAETLSRHWRIGAAWLYLSADGDPKKNQEIICQRLDPQEAIQLDKPVMDAEERTEKETEEASGHTYVCAEGDDLLFAGCISNRRDFHIDPYGQMAFCAYIKDPAMRYDLRQGSFTEGWEEFIPSLADEVKGGREYLDNCGSCEIRSNCRWCPVYGYLEHRRFSAKVDYLCDVAKENRRFREEWKMNHRRYYQVAGITIRVDSDLPITDTTFVPKFKLFQVDGPGEDNISIRHHFSLPELDDWDLGKEIYRRVPWAIYRKGNRWIYVGITGSAGHQHIHKVFVSNHDHTRIDVYSDGEEGFYKGGLHSLTYLPTDQILLARVLADREGCYLHSSGIALNGKGLLFVGNSGAGKSSITRMFKDKSELLCDDRMIVRRWPEGYKIHGNWSHGTVPEVSPNSAPLTAIIFLEKAQGNHLIFLDDKKEVVRRILSCMIKPLATADWWDKTLSLVEKIAREVPCYSAQFDLSGGIVDLLERL